MRIGDFADYFSRNRDPVRIGRAPPAFIPAWAQGIYSAEGIQVTGRCLPAKHPHGTETIFHVFLSGHGEDVFLECGQSPFVKDWPI
jgi:hypothetical protein